MKFIIGLILGGSLTVFFTHYDYADARLADLRSFLQTVELPSAMSEKPSTTALPEPRLAAETQVVPAVKAEELPEIADEIISQPIELAEPESGSAVVWTAFRSEASATGFARHLTTSVSHPFSVNRLGPGTYQVTYTYTDAAEATRLAEQIALITGAK